jgi:3',5'-cyclic AMP phosphodiesterase CpdA
MRRFFLTFVPLFLLAVTLLDQRGLAGAGSTASAQTTSPAKLDVRLPLQDGSVRFAVIGDSGTGSRQQYELARLMDSYRGIVKFDMVLMLGDNIYGNHTPGDFIEKFEQPYKPMLDAGVKFYASLGNHDDPNDERLYKPFNMGGERYYAFRKGDVAFFALDSNYMDPTQLNWVDQNLKSSEGKWKICFFHHPLYNDGKHHGSDLDLRSRLLPIFERNGVRVVFSGHEHVYQRMKPANGIDFFVLGNSGKLMTHDFRSESGDRVKGFDTDLSFMVVEVSGDQMYFQTIARTGGTIDSGQISRVMAAQAATSK